MKQALYWIVFQIAGIHEAILQLNNGFELHFSDKELHFLVIGMLGMGIYFVVNPLFAALVRRGKSGIISGIYTLTVIVVITFAIEIGQHITSTGSMDFGDIVFGVVGFLLFFAVYGVIYRVVKAIFRK